MAKNEKDYINEITVLKAEIDAFQMSENEANEIIAELKAYKDVNEDFKTAWEELKAENDRLRDIIKSIIKPVLLPDVPIEVTNKYKQTLQEIKELINTCMEFRTCERCKFFKMCDKDLEGCILSLITKAEEE